MTRETLMCQVARLAKIGLTDAESLAFQKDLDRMLVFLSTLSQVDTHGIDPLLTPAQHTCPLRPDVIATNATVDQILRNAPAQGQNMFLVPTMMDAS